MSRQTPRALGPAPAELLSTPRPESLGLQGRPPSLTEGVQGRESPGRPKGTDTFNREGQTHAGTRAMPRGAHWVTNWDSSRTSSTKLL